MTASGTILVTGASGQVGEGVVDRLTAAGRPVALLRHRSDPAARHAGLPVVGADLREADGMPAVAGIEAVVHTAALWLLPAHLPALLAAGARRVVAFGSTSLHGKAGSGDPAERRMVERLAAAEGSIAALCGSAGVPWTILRPSLIYGRGRDRNVTAAARFILRFGVYPVAPPAAGLRQPVHAEDLAVAAVQALDSPAAFDRAYDIGGGETLPYREMIGRIFDVLGWRRRILPVPGLAAFVGAAAVLGGRAGIGAEAVRRMNRDLAWDDGAAARDFGYAPRRFLAAGRADLGL